MFRLALRTLRFRKGSFIASFIALFVGGVIVLACGGLMETGITRAVAPQRLAAAPIVVAGDPSYLERPQLDRSLLTEIGAVAGVADVVPDVSFPVSPLVNGDSVPGGELATGHGWASAALGPYTVRDGSEPSRTGEVVFDTVVATQSGVGVGDEVELAVRGQTERFRVVGVADGPGRPGTSSIFFTEAEAQRLAGKQDTVTAIGVFAEPGADIGAVAQQIGGTLPETAVVLTGDDRGLAEFTGVAAAGENLIIVAGIFGGLGIMVAMFVVAGTLGLSVQQRVREMALLRAIGTTPGQLRRMILGEAMVIAVFAIGFAYLPNLYVGRWLLEQLITAGVAPAGVRFQQGWVPVVAAGGIALFTALSAAFIASRAAARTRPTEALAEAGLPTRWLSWIRVLFAVLFLAGGLALVIVTGTVMSGPIAASTSTFAPMLLASGLALLGPGITRVLTAIFRWPLRAVSGVAGQLAILNASARKIRMAGAVMPIMLATGLSTALIYMQTAQVSAAESAFTDSLRADLVLSAETGGLPVDFTDSVREQPGVAAASALVPGTGYLPDPNNDPDENDYDSVPILGVTATDIAAASAITPTAGALEDLRGNTIALSTSDAEAQGVGVGDTTSVRLGDGFELDVTVVALYETDPGYENALLPAQLVAEHTASGLVPQILVRAAADADLDELTATLGGLATQVPGLRVADRDDILAVQAEREEISAWVNFLLVAMIVGYTVISLVNTLIISTGERRREFALQRLIGATRGQIMRMMTVEVALMVIAGVALGTAVALTTLIPFSAAMGTSLPGGPLWIYFAVIGTAAALTLVATMVSAGYALRSRPTEVAAAE